jgi:hypothetical protein
LVSAIFRYLLSSAWIRGSNMFNIVDIEAGTVNKQFSQFLYNWSMKTSTRRLSVIFDLCV